MICKLSGTSMNDAGILWVISADRWLRALP